jgi:hypothetical protein
MNDKNTPFALTIAFQIGICVHHIQFSQHALWELRCMLELGHPENTFDRVGFIKSLRNLYPFLTLKNALTVAESAIAVAHRTERPDFTQERDKFSKITDFIETW